MTLTARFILVAMLVFATVAPESNAIGQATRSANPEPSPHAQFSPQVALTPETLPLGHQAQSRLWNLWTPEVSSTPQTLFDFRDSDIKFSLQNMMNVLRDSTHEGWVLAAYPDPKTSRPLIGAGFGLDVAATEHIQRDPLNPHTFLEPSTAQLWQAAGLDAGQLRSILEQFNRELEAWKKKKFRKKIKTLPPDITADEATLLLRISAVQAIYNAKAYCRYFDQLTASQQMALSQLVFQMGVNLEEFVQFLAALNREPSYPSSDQPKGPTETEAEHWEAVQHTLIDSDWARRYTNRAVTVIAMLNPEYANDPIEAQRQVRAAIHPLVVPHHKKGHVAAVRAGNKARTSGNAVSKTVSPHE